MNDMEYNFDFLGNIYFKDVLKIYEEIISVGFKPVNYYSLWAINYELGIRLTSQFHFNEDEFQVTYSNGLKEKDLSKRIEDSGKRFVQDIEDSLSEDILVANSPYIRYYSEIERWSFENIAKEEIVEMESYKMPRYFPLIGEKLNCDIPFVQGREIKISKDSDKYDIKIISSSMKTLDEMENGIFNILNGH